jgi:cell wall assembly regulator SMI1
VPGSLPGTCIAISLEPDRLITSTDLSMLIKLLQDVAAELHNIGVDVELFLEPPVGAEELQRLQEANAVTLPPELIDLYTKEAGGMLITWDHRDTGGMFELPRPQDLLANKLSFRDLVAEIADDRAYIDKHTDAPFREDAYRIWNSMREWIPLYHEADGDQFCIRPEDGRVVYNQHDWFDGFGTLAETNGLVVGDSISDFVTRWARFYFTCPASLWWGDCVRTGTFEWDESLFDPEFIRPQP